MGGLAISHLLGPGAFDRVIALGRRPLPARPPLGLQGRLRRYRGVEADAVAAAAARAALDPTPGRLVWEYGTLVG